MSWEEINPKSVMRTSDFLAPNSGVLEINVTKVYKVSFYPWGKLIFSKRNSLLGKSSTMENFLIGWLVGFVFSVCFCFFLFSFGQGRAARSCLLQYSQDKCHSPNLPEINLSLQLPNSLPLLFQRIENSNRELPEQAQPLLLLHAPLTMFTLPHGFL